MCHKTILARLLLVTGILCWTAMGDDQASPQKSGEPEGAAQSGKATPGPGMMGKGMMGGSMMGKGMMAGPMMERGMKMMEMHQKMQDEWKAMDAENERLVTDMNQATGQKKIDAMAALLTRLVAQRKTMNDKMGAMHADMMQMMMEGMGAGTTHQPPTSDKNPPAQEHPATSDNSQHLQHQH
jgi:hypothetical protein